MRTRGPQFLIVDGASLAPRVCLVMVAKDRPEVLRRALDSARPLISAWMVSVEPGDPLAAEIPVMLAGIPGEVVEYDRENGGQARTLMMQHGARVAREHGCSYLLNLDADDELRPEVGFAWPILTEPVYALTHIAGPMRYPFPRLFRADIPWRWEGLLHEVPVCDVDAPSVLLDGLTYVDHKEGRTSERYHEHARVLLAEHERDPENARTVYFLAQSYRSAGDLDSAYRYYARRVEMGGYHEEVYYSWMCCASLLRATGQPWEKARFCYLMAHQVAPERAEPLCELAEHMVDTDREVARALAEKAAAMPMPRGGMMVYEPAYTTMPAAILAACEDVA